MAKSGDCARLYKVIMLGEMSVGKSSIKLRWGSGITSKQVTEIKETIGAEPITKKIIVDGTPMKLTVWDPAGQERVRKVIMPVLYRNVDAVIFVYDATVESSFEMLKLWFTECKDHGIDISIVPCAVISNKCDLPNIVVTKEMGQKFSDEHEMMFYHSSALLDSEREHLNDIFLQLGRMLKYSKRQLNYDPDVIKVEEKPLPEPQSSSCYC